MKDPKMGTINRSFFFSSFAFFFFGGWRGGAGYEAAID